MITTADKQRLPAALLDPACYPHPVEKVRVIETHMSWVFLTGRYAYKVKKPVDLGFANFSSLRLRRRYCREELRLNRRLAPQLYLDIVAIRGNAQKPRIGGKGPVLEYAVRMRQFPQAALASRALASGTFDARKIDGLADRIAAFHARTPKAPPGSAFGSPMSALAIAIENVDQMLVLANRRADRAPLLALRQWTRREHSLRRGAFEARKLYGAIRECHGDLHLGNVALIDGEPVPFDCIEFNDDFRWVDVMNEVAFLVMELDHHRRNDLGWRFLNRYLESTGDYDGVRVLRFYLVYRALVRAKVHLMRSLQPGQTSRDRTRLARAFHDYVRLAGRYSAPPRAALVITYGLSGSGKTTVTQSVIERMGAIRLRSDVERKRLHGIPALASSRSARGGGIYTPAATAATYRRLGVLARLVVESGYTVIVDATFLERAEREAFRAVAGASAVPFLILDFRVPLPELRRRVETRSAKNADASEADRAILEHQIACYEPLSPAERAVTLSVDGRLPPERALSDRRWAKKLSN